MTAIAVGGTLTTAFLASKASFKAAELIHEEESSQGYDLPNGRLDTREKAELVWKLYIPAAGTAVLTVTAIIMSHHISSRRAAAMAAAFSISEKAFVEYREKVIDKMGEKKEQSVRDEIAQDRLNRNPVGQQLVIVGSGDVLCYDAYIDRYFTSNMETLRKAQNDINFQVLNDHYASLSDFYDLLGLPHAQVSENVGWNLDKEFERYDMKTVEVTLPEVASDVEAVVETAKKVNLFTPKRLIVAAGVALVVTGSVLVVKKIRAAKAAAEAEALANA
jgi:hypothetical protein